MASLSVPRVGVGVSSLFANSLSAKEKNVKLENYIYLYTKLVTSHERTHKAEKYDTSLVPL